MKTCLAGLAGLACASLLLAASPVVAHHSAAMFDPGHQVHIQGIVKEVQWTVVGQFENCPTMSDWRTWLVGAILKA